jgi:hypothetical protein
VLTSAVLTSAVLTSAVLIGWLRRADRLAQASVLSQAKVRR